MDAARTCTHFFPRLSIPLSSLTSLSLSLSLFLPFPGLHPSFLASLATLRPFVTLLLFDRSFTLFSAALLSSSSSFPRSFFPVPFRSASFLPVSPSSRPIREHRRGSSQSPRSVLSSRSRSILVLSPAKRGRAAGPASVMVRASHRRISILASRTRQPSTIDRRSAPREGRERRPRVFAPRDCQRLPINGPV